jgi:hypothetical protein
MTEQAIDRGRNGLWTPAAMPIMAGACAYLVLLPLGGRLLSDPDTYSHIAVGRWIVEHRTFPTGDPFSHSMPGAPWAAFEWGSQLLLYGAHSFAGWLGVVILTAAAIAAGFGLLTYFLRQHLRPLATAIFVLAAFVLVLPHTLARPHALVFPFMVAWVGVLLRTAEAGRAPPWWLLGLITVWANLHGSFTFGLAIMAPIALEAILQADTSDRRLKFWQWARFGVLALLAGALTPYGFELMVVTYRTMALGDALKVTGEWKPQDFTNLRAFEILLLGGIAYAFTTGLRLPPLRLLMLLGIVHMALAHVRFADLLGLLGPLIIAAPLARHLRTPAEIEDAMPRQFDPRPGVVATVMIVAATGALALQRAPEPAAENTPAAAIAASAMARTAPILNHYDFGAYLDFIGIRPFIDGRAEAYGAAFIIRYHRATTMADPDDLPRLLDDYRIGVTLFPPKTPAVAMLDRLPGWRRVYADDVAVLHEKSQGTAQTEGLRRPSMH